ncbi:flagellar hook protein FlgE [Azovibrio restrictus]|uniref:flagellar hook protein FlgE n=1 Tax=Azovibrio restrictus TaxID=146938 RepID=UPI0026E976CD|nr:flagellar hook protein FlgE [Azovibrio restrictus]
MAFQQGLSGLNVYSRALDVVSNNIANASTVGFKAAQAQFADVYAGALNGAGATQVGIGVSLPVVMQQFTQGNIATTNNPLDIAINGNGFFRLQKSVQDQTGYYSRNGQFYLNRDGYVVNSTNGGYLTGYSSPDGVSVDSSAIVPLSVGTGGIEPKQTGWSSVIDASKGGLTVSINLDNRDKKAASIGSGSEWTQLTPFAWDSTFNTSMYNYSTSATIYDQSGASHTLTNYYVRQGDSGTDARTWNVYTVIDNRYLVSTTPNQLVFEPNGTLVGNPGDYRFQLDLSATVMQDGTPMDLTSDAGLNWFAQRPGVSGNFAFYMNLGETTQFGMAYNPDNITQDGYTAGTLTKLSVDEAGYVLGNYSNGQTKLMGQVVLAEFINPNGLQNMGDNLWIETFASGQPTIGMPSAGTRGKLQSGAVEESNTDLTQELVDMIIMQRNYQANAQSIKTQDQILQTLVNLR